MGKLLLLGFIFALTLISQETFAQTAKQVAGINADVAAINRKVKSYRKTTKPVEGVSLEGTEATYFASGKSLKKIKAEIFGETYDATAEIYFQGEKPIFAVENINRYNVPIGITPRKRVKTEERRVYFVNEKSIKTMVGSKAINSKTEKFKEINDEMNDLIGKLKAAF
ncbi:MAG: hypothetical protein H7Z37_17210 [Pyrinomonadaceae bacterium]|nr:hypothetical protein [Pyrinomonadaceae bacterium]